MFVIFFIFECSQNERDVLDCSSSFVVDYFNRLEMKELMVGVCGVREKKKRVYRKVCSVD